VIATTVLKTKALFTNYCTITYMYIIKDFSMFYNNIGAYYNITTNLTIILYSNVVSNKNIFSNFNIIFNIKVFTKF